MNENDMFGHIEAVIPKRGKTVPIILDMLPGSPVVHVEHLGDTNESYLAEQIARANEKPTFSSNARKVTKKTVREIIERKRHNLEKHVIRHLEASRRDGSKATDADIPRFVAAIPAYVVERIHDHAANADNYLETAPEAAVADVAEK